MSATNLAAAEVRGDSAAAGTTTLDDDQRAYLEQVIAFERLHVDQIRQRADVAAARAAALVDRLVHRSVRAIVAQRLADAVAADDEASVRFLRPVYRQVQTRDDASRPGVGLYTTSSNDTM